MKIFYKKDAEEGWFVNDDIEWIIPVSAIEYFGVFYKVMAHGSLIQNSKGESGVMTLGTEILTRPTDIKELEDGYFSFIYKRDSKFMETTNTAKSVQNLYSMLDLILTGRVSNRVPYTLYLDTLKNSMKANMKIAVAPSILSVILGAVFRNSQNPKIPARCIPEANYTPVSLSDLPALNNSFNAAMGEYFTRGMVIATGNSRDEQEANMNPLEKAMRM